MRYILLMFICIGLLSCSTQRQSAFASEPVEHSDSVKLDSASRQRQRASRTFTFEAAEVQKYEDSPMALGPGRPPCRRNGFLALTVLESQSCPVRDDDVNMSSQETLDTLFKMFENYATAEELNVIISTYPAYLIERAIDDPMQRCSMRRQTKNIFECFEETIETLNKIVNDTTICISRHRIISYLHSASDSLKRNYLEVEEKMIGVWNQNRPILICGSYENGQVVIGGYEELIQYAPIRGLQLDIRMILNYIGNLFSYHRLFWQHYYAFHSIGTPYYNVDALDSIKLIYHNEYLIPAVRKTVEAAGNDFDSLWRRLHQNRTAVTAAKIENDFAVLAGIRGMRPVLNSDQTNICELDVTIQEVSFNKDSVYFGPMGVPPRSLRVKMYKDGECPHLSNLVRPLYLFGNFNDALPFIDSFVSPWSAFVFGDTVYDISMGFPFEEFLTYFLPPSLSFEEILLGFYVTWRYDRWRERRGMMRHVRELLNSLSPNQREIIDAATQRVTEFFRERQEHWNADSLSIQQEQRAWRKSRGSRLFNVFPYAGSCLCIMCDRGFHGLVNCE